MELTAEQRMIVEQVMASEEIPGVSVAMVKDGEIIHAEGFGYARLADRAPMTPETVQAIASLTKSFTGVAIMQLVERGLLSLDEPVRSYLPSFQAGDPDESRKMTPRVLLSHKSGMGRTGLQDRMFSEDTPPYRDRADLVSRLAGIELQCPPNRAYSYCNEGFVTLGLLLETVSNIPLQEYFQTHIFDPVGMSRTVATSAGRRSFNNRAVGHVANDGELEAVHLPADYSIYLPGGGISSSAIDLARYQMASMNAAASPLLTAGSLDQMQTVSTPFGDTGWGYGLGWRVSWNGGRNVVEHGGGLPGISTYSMMIPSEQAGVVVLTNRAPVKTARFAELLLNTILDSPVYRDDVNLPLPFSTRFPIPHDLYEFAGSYHFSNRSSFNTEAHIEVRSQPDMLMMRHSDITPDEEKPVVAVGKDTFMGRIDGDMTYFLRDEQGSIRSLLWGGNQYHRQ